MDKKQPATARSHGQMNSTRGNDGLLYRASTQMEGPLLSPKQHDWEGELKRRQTDLMEKQIDTLFGHAVGNKMMMRHLSQTAGSGAQQALMRPHGGEKT
jgi:hypothetical protein